MKKIVSLMVLLVLFMGCLSLVRTSMKSRRQYIGSHSFLTEDIKRCILEGKITKGMTTKDVLASWGRPNDINRSVGSWGVHEQWVYGRTDASYLYFENDILTSWQN